MDYFPIPFLMKYLQNVTKPPKKSINQRGMGTQYVPIVKTHKATAMTFFDGEWFLTKIVSLRSVSCARFSLLKDFHQTLHTCIKAWCVQLALLVLFTTMVSLNAHSQELCRRNKSQWHHNEGKADDCWHVALVLTSGVIKERAFTKDNRREISYYPWVH